jgi:hypothetical protein
MTVTITITITPTAPQPAPTSMDDFSTATYRDFWRELINSADAWEKSLARKDAVNAGKDYTVFAKKGAGWVFWNGERDDVERIARYLRLDGCEVVVFDDTKQLVTLEEASPEAQAKIENMKYQFKNPALLK